jgi:hypothetical protein
MDLKGLEAELDEIVEDDGLKNSFKDWINTAILQIAADFELPALRLLEPATVEVDSTNWIWELPTDFHKKLFRCNFVDVSGATNRVTVYDRRDDLEYRDHTITSPRVTGVAVATQGEKSYLLIDPLPVDWLNLNLWYYRKPKVLTDPDDVCDAFPAEFHDRVIVPKVIIKNYQKLLDQVVSANLQGITYWEGEYAKGLYGVPGQGAGLINYLAKTEKPPRRTGGRDPVGRRWSRG